MTARATTTHPTTATQTAVIGAVIVARMKSSRLPGKSMVEIEGRPSLEWMLRRLAASRRVTRTIVATTTDPSDEPIVSLADRLGYPCFRGSENDVLARVCGAIRSAGIDVVVHLTGDCPLIDPQLIDAVVDLFLAQRADYASLDFDACMKGLDVEVFSAEALSRVETSFSDPWIREHVTEPLYTMSERFRAIKLPILDELRRPAYRVCIDTPEDHALVKDIFARLLPVREDFTASDIVKLLDAHPELVAINQAVTQTKYACGIIGLGDVGTAYGHRAGCEQGIETHASAYLEYGKTRLATGCDPDPTRREAFAACRKIEHVYASAAEMFSGEDLAIVSVATPVETHGDLCLQAATAGVRAILCEKPFVLDPEQGRRVARACEKMGVLLAVNYWMRWSNLYRNLRDFLDGGGLGEIQCVRCHYSKGALNSGTHAVDLLRFLFGEIVSVRATECIELDTGDDNIGGVVRLETGFPAHLTVSDYREHMSFELDVIGTSGRLRSADDEVAYWRAGPTRSQPRVRRLQPAPVPFDTSIGTPFRSAVAELVEHLDSDRGRTSCTAEDGVRAVEVVLALQQSWTSGGQAVDAL